MVYAVIDTNILVSALITTHNSNASQRQTTRLIFNILSKSYHYIC